MSHVTAEFTLSFYSQLLTSLGLAVEGSHVVMQTEDGSSEITVGDKALVLPTRELLNKPNWATQMAFNPLCENTLRGESEVQKELTTMVKYAVNIRLIALIWRLLKVCGIADAASKEGKDNGLKPAQAEFLSYFPGYDKTMANNFAKVSQGIDPDVYNASLIHLNLNRRYQIGDRKWERVCLTRFPFQDVGRKEKPWSHLRVKDMDALCSIMEFILPGWNVENTYSVGTDQKVAPYFATLATVYYKINSRIREVAKPFVEDFPEFAAVITEDPWFEHMDKFSAMRETLPVLEGNEGVLPKGQAGAEAPSIGEPAAAKSINVPLPRSGQQAQQPLPWEEAKPAQATSPAPAQHQQPRKVDEEVVEYVPRQPTPAPQYPHSPPPQVQSGQIPMGYGQPQQPKHESQMSFHELAQLRAMQRGGYAAAQPQLPPVGGSPFAAGATTSVPAYAQPVQQPVQPGGPMQYVTPGMTPSNTGPGF